MGTCKIPSRNTRVGLYTLLTMLRMEVVSGIKNMSLFMLRLNLTLSSVPIAYYLPYFRIVFLSTLSAVILRTVYLLLAWDVTSLLIKEFILERKRKSLDSGSRNSVVSVRHWRVTGLIERWNGFRGFKCGGSWRTMFQSEIIMQCWLL